MSNVVTGGAARRGGWRTTIFISALVAVQVILPAAVFLLGPNSARLGLPITPARPDGSAGVIDLAGEAPGPASDQSASDQPEGEAPAPSDEADGTAVASVDEPAEPSPAADGDGAPSREPTPPQNDGRRSPGEVEGGLSGTTPLPGGNPPRQDPGPGEPPQPPPPAEPVLLASVEDSVAGGVMTLSSFGSSGSAVMSFQALDPEQPTTCSVGAQDPVVIPVRSSNESVAVVTPGTVEYDACSGIDRIAVHPVSEGVATVELGAATDAPDETNLKLETTSFEVQVVDSLPRNLEPTVDVPPGMLVETDDPAGAVVTWERSAFDREDGDIPATCTPRSGSLLPLGDTEVICSATDSGGLSDTASFVVSVVPVQDPGDDPGDDPQPPPEPKAPDTAKPYAPSIDVPTADFVGSTGAWHRDAVTVIVRHNGDRVMQDGSRVSGVDPSSFERRILVQGSGAHTISGITVTDRAGNVSNPAPEVVVRIDATAPSVTLTCPSDALETGAEATASWTAADGESGLAGAARGTLPLDTSTPGTHTALLGAGTAVDNVGHPSAARSRSYTVEEPPAPEPQAGSGGSGSPTGENPDDTKVTTTATEQATLPEQQPAEADEPQDD